MAARSPEQQKKSDFWKEWCPWQRSWTSGSVKKQETDRWERLFGGPEEAEPPGMQGVWGAQPPRRHGGGGSPPHDPPANMGHYVARVSAKHGSEIRPNPYSNPC